MPNFEEKKRTLSEALRASSGEVRLKKDLSHLFRSRFQPPSAKLDMRTFNEVLEVDEAAGTVDVEGMTSYAKLAEATLAHGLLVIAAVLPEFLHPLTEFVQWIAQKTKPGLARVEPGVVPQSGKSRDRSLTFQIDVATHKAFEQALVEEQEAISLRPAGFESYKHFALFVAGG